MSNLNKFLQSFNENSNPKDEENKSQKDENKSENIVLNKAGRPIKIKNSGGNNVEDIKKTVNSRNIKENSDNNSNFTNNENDTNKNGDLEKDGFLNSIFNHKTEDTNLNIENNESNLFNIKDEDKKEINQPKRSPIKLIKRDKSNLENSNNNDIKDIGDNDNSDSDGSVDFNKSSKYNKSKEEIFLENRRKEKEIFKELEEDLKKSRKNENLNYDIDNSSNKRGEVINSCAISNAPERTEDFINRMFIESETNIRFKEKWIELYEKAINSDKKTIINNKIRNGRFRIKDDGKLEILADFNTYGKTSKELLNMRWKL